MAERPNTRPGRSPIRRERELESAVLALLIESHPRTLTEAELITAMTAVADSPDRIEAVAKAIVELLGVGLLVRDGDRLVPTPAALRTGELEIGL